MTAIQTIGHSNHDIHPFVALLRLRGVTAIADVRSQPVSRRFPQFDAPVAYAETAPMPKDLPAYSADKPLPVPEIAKRVLDNGMTVWVVPSDGVPRVDYVLAFKDAGLAADPADMPGLASMVAGLLNEGTEKLDSRAIAETAQSYGGSVGAAAGTDGFTVFANARASKAEPMMQLMSQIARTPTFPEKEVTLAKANALQGLKAAEAQPGFRAERAMLSAVYGDHPYARTQGTEESINAGDPPAITCRWRCRPNFSLWTPPDDRFAASHLNLLCLDWP